MLERIDVIGQGQDEGCSAATGKRARRVAVKSLSEMNSARSARRSRLGAVRQISFNFLYFNRLVLGTTPLLTLQRDNPCGLCAKQDYQG